MSRLWIKICGVTRPQDAVAAVELGASAIGMVFFARSPRAMTLDAAYPILRELNRKIRVVALFVDPVAAEVRQVSGSGLFDMLQFHGDEPAAFCESFDLPYMKAIKVGQEQQENEPIAVSTLAKSELLLDKIRDYAGAEIILLDSFDKKVPGGTGKTFDWAVAAAVRRQCGVKLVLAGGLDPANVETAVAQVQPYGVDVSSGVEARHGIKDLQKMQRFVAGARGD
ncbi:MAG TPA: phosphoribosylanthranilate isomerase [Porticoccaceae bacterium]|nr:phosphoribosylanthranilate isomerase [Porticoccaceae bacterium]